MQNSNITKVTDFSNNSSSNFNSIIEQRLEGKQNKEMDTSLPKKLIPKVLPFSFKSLKKMEIDTFLDKMYKKKVSDKIR